YLQNSNILTVCTFITHFVAALPRASDSPLQVGDVKVVLVKDQVVNFTQLVVLTCQHVQGQCNKAVQESWVRLCGNYQSRGGLLATPEVRQAQTKVSTLYYALVPPYSQTSNPLGDIILSMFGGLEAAQPTRCVLAPAGISSRGLD
ncbi:hypothetical protein DFH08DRAFT_709198, partial [Mycena albidolilacea]